MGRYIDGQDRAQSVLFPERLVDWIEEDNPVRAVDVFVDQLDLLRLGFERAQPAETGRPAYHPATVLKIYIYGYLNRVQSSRRLEREAQRNVELIRVPTPAVAVAHGTSLGLSSAGGRKPP
jgi:transposase